MDREIKFRAWDIIPHSDDEEEKREMIYFNLYDTGKIADLYKKISERKVKHK